MLYLWQEKVGSVFGKLEAAKRYVRGGYDVVVDGIIGPWFLKPWLNIVQEKNQCASDFAVLGYMNRML